ncbi:hypothetical protein JX265_008890 [Neoarthrinium moseri]|uniref:VOC domain-containing protein n=1 Tax=Neoarthrinium moseri TaxID=1658444 RepID=A0A9P9WHN5_9PEZI|nr:uncharacterized protein JN550_013721 [Neoarthrinium moseri]KAI1848329.1 hypothetical protein JX266_005635 [Neoarthrinium moseri]KAI1856682.1 hypothetical protein JN550_013721 [Neoarthrinium moseri]KAI1863673.1 hypothetical protein JX265_008890 [Neoarthrinium moseri]
MLPYVEVSYLPASASFYSAVTHPLGLRYISANPGSIVYGAASPTDPDGATTPTFEVRSVSERAGPLKHSRLVLSAGSPEAVRDFHAAALRAYPDLPLIGAAGDSAHRHSDAEPSFSGDNRARIQDLDGNIMEVVYVPPNDYPSRPGESTIRRTQSTTDQVGRILDWNLDVASSSPSKSVAGSGAVGGSATAVARRAGGPEEEPPRLLRRSVTTSTIETSSSPRENSNGISTGAVVGTVLGAVAAGAAIGGALTYMGMKKERERAPRQEFEAPAFQRRSTFPDPYPDHKPKYVERTVEKIYYPDQLPPVRSRHYPPPSYVAKYSQGPIRSREVEELDDRSSRHSTRHSTSGRTRTRSETGSMRRPMMIADAEYRSNAGSKYTTAPKMLMDVEHRSHAGSRHSSNLLPEADHWSRAPSKHSVPRSIRHHEPEVETYISSRSKRDPEAETYVSSRSKKSERSDRSESTIRPARQSVVYDAPQSIMYGDVPIRSRAPSKAPTKGPSVVPSRHSTAHSASTVKMAPTMSRANSYTTARMVPLPESRLGSMVSARDIPLPESHADWDNDSIAPSDSISCIGSRSRSGRSYH